MHPVLHEGRDPGVRFGLGDLRLVMREHQFRRPSVEVVLRSEVSDRDRRVLDVPSRPALAPRAVPRGLPRLAGPPEDEIGGIPVSFPSGDPGPPPACIDATAAYLAPTG